MTEATQEPGVTPRVNGRLMKTMPNMIVALVGKVISQNQEEGRAMIQASDGAQIQVAMQPGNTYETDYVEILGHTGDDASELQEFKSSDFGHDFDLQNYDKLVELSNTQYGDIFFGAQQAKAQE